MKGFGIYANFGYPLKMDERARMIKDAGFKAASLWWEEYDLVNEIPLFKQPEIFYKLGLALDYIHAPFVNINDIWTNSKYAIEAVNIHKKWLDECAYFEIPIMVMHVTLWDLAYDPNDFGIWNMEKILEYAEKKGIIIALENVGATGHVQFLLDAFDSPFLKFCYDSSHNWVFNRSLAPEVLERNISRLVCTHLSDNDEKEDRHWLPGYGKVDWNGIKSILRENNYSGYLSMEVFPKDYNQNPKAFVKEAYDSIQMMKY